MLEQDPLKEDRSTIDRYTATPCSIPLTRIEHVEGRLDPTSTGAGHGDNLVRFVHACTRQRAHAFGRITERGKCVDFDRAVRHHGA